MKYGFVLDNRKCIGCHACTVACKSEHDVPVGVNRTYVKQVEKGEYPNTTRLFSVTRCNHCTDAPCVEICPVECLHIRPDGIVDFNDDRCIGCKSCMQACPYDALFINPDTNTASKCNYCAHRIDIGLEPACVNVCPEQAIISGDMENPDTEISMLLATQNTMVRKPEKGTSPNVFYINSDEVMLTPSATAKTEETMWSAQSNGVGHYAKYAESLAKKSYEEMADTLANNPDTVKTYAGDNQNPEKSQMAAILGKSTVKRVYDTPDKGVLWGWEVSGYVFTKAISAGAVLVLALAALMNVGFSTETTWLGIGLGLGFLTLTGALLVKDLDQPMRFAYVLLRPQWNSWLVRGGYAITVFGGLLTVWGAGLFFEIPVLADIAMWTSALSAILVAVYTAFLFAQAKGRDFWQSPTLPLHMFVHSVMAGAGALAIGNFLMAADNSWGGFLENILVATLVFNVILLVVELGTTHPAADAKATVNMIMKGRYKNRFWYGVVVFGNLLPIAMVVFGAPVAATGLVALIGILLQERVWVEAPQRISLS